MKKIEFYYQLGPLHQKVTDIVEFEDEATEFDIQEWFTDWIFSRLSDKWGWNEIESTHEAKGDKR